MKAASGIEGWVFVGLAGLLSLITFAGLRLPYELQVGFLVVLVAILGLPHGALDLEIAREAGFLRDRLATRRFIGAYLGLVAFTIMGWIVAPGPMLLLFLAMSAWHFAGDWRTHLNRPLRLAVGGCVVALPALFHIGEVADLFGLLVPPPTAGAAAEGLQALALGLLPLAAVAVVVAGHIRISFEIATLAVAAAVLSPLVFFVVYFCFLHSPRHLAEALPGVGGSTAAVLRRVWPIVGLTWLGAAGVAALLPSSIPSTVAVQVVFVGLSALTVPHMLLIEWWANRPLKKPAGRDPLVE